MEIGARMQAGELPARLVADSGVEPVDIVAALALSGLGDSREPGPALVQSVPQRPSLRAAASEAALADLFPGNPRPALLALAAGLLQALDLWDASHEAAQEADDLGEKAFSPYWHAIAHRREPDPGNAGYWFRRVGRHPQFVELGDSVRSLPETQAEPALAARLMPGGSWDPMAFVAFCGEAARRYGSDAERLARRIQRLEMLILIDATAGGGS
jgi:hypothetical protein